MIDYENPDITDLIPDDLPQFRRQLIAPEGCYVSVHVEEHGFETLRVAQTSSHETLLSMTVRGSFIKVAPSEDGMLTATVSQEDASDFKFKFILDELRELDSAVPNRPSPSSS